MVNVIPWTEQVEEIRSCNVRIERNLAINIISLNFATFLGCRVKTEQPTIALVKNEPVSLLGKTNILLRLPKSKKRRGTFTKIEMTVAKDPKNHIILARSTQVLLGLYPKTVKKHYTLNTALSTATNIQNENFTSLSSKI